MPAVMAMYNMKFISVSHADKIPIKKKCFYIDFYPILIHPIDIFMDGPKVESKHVYIFSCVSKGKTSTDMPCRRLDPSGNVYLYILRFYSVWRENICPTNEIVWNKSLTQFQMSGAAHYTSSIHATQTCVVYNSQQIAVLARTRTIRTLNKYLQMKWIEYIAEHRYSRFMLPSPPLMSTGNKSKNLHPS